MSISEMSCRNGVRTIYTDGGCYNNGIDKGVGAWAFVEYDKHANIVDVFCGFESDTTNNRTEMMAIINGIKHFDQHTNIDIISDSGYVVKGYNHPAYLDRWIKNNWKTSTNTPVQNQDLWEEIINLTYKYGVKFKLIRGHYKDPNALHASWNAIVDQVCTHIMCNYRIDGSYKCTYDLMSRKIISVERI